LTHSLQIHCIGLIGPRLHMFWAWATNRDPTVSFLTTLDIYKDYFKMPSQIFWYSSLTTCFQFLNNIIRIFAHTYFQKIQTMLLEQHYQMAPKLFEILKVWACVEYSGQWVLVIATVV